MNREDKVFWLENLDPVHRRLRRVALLGVGLFVLVVGDGYLRHQELADEQLLLNTTITELVESSHYDEEIEAVISEGCDITWVHPGIFGAISLEHLPELSTAASARIRERSKDIRTRKLWDFELPIPLYRLALLIAPLILLVITMVSNRQIRSIHLLLQDNLTDTNVQQKLNSPYFTRITLSYGKGWWWQTVIFGAINFIHVLCVIIYLPAVLGLSNVTFLWILDKEIINVEVFASSEGASAQWGPFWFIFVLCTLVLWAIAIFWFHKIPLRKRRN